MSHQVIITFDMDENKIQENAEKEAGRQIAKDVVQRTFGTGYNADRMIKQVVLDIIKEMLEPEKDEIIEQAVKYLVDSLKRSKAVKDKLAVALDEMEEEK